MLKTSLQRVAICLVLAVATAGAHAATETRFTVVDSSSTSWVAQGLQNYTVTPAMGWSFDVSRNFDNSLSFNISGSPVAGTSIDLWFLDFAAPFGAELVPGLYEDFQRYPFQDADRPGLAFGSTGRLDNMASGYFDILEASYDDAGNLVAFAADFLHFGETNADNWAMVELRYNATVIPLPGAVWLMLSGLIGLVSLRNRR